MYMTDTTHDTHTVAKPLRRFPCLSRPSGQRRRRADRQDAVLRRTRANMM